MKFRRPKKKFHFHFLIFLSLIFPPSAWAFNQKALQLNKEAIERLSQQDATAGVDLLTQAIAEDPYHAELHYNLGVGFTLKGDGEKAKSAYLSAEKLVKQSGEKNSELLFLIHFNLGEMAGKQGKIDEALQYYQLALGEKPDSIETKTNIELLIQDQQNGKGGKGEGKDKDDKENSEQSENGEQKEKKDDQKKKYADNPKPQPKKFDSENLSQSDVNKILGEIKQQEQKIRREYNKKEVKERPRDKNW